MRKKQRAEGFMEQLNVTSSKDNERMFKILTDLMNTDKEFQIMITVPSGNRRKEEDVKQKSGIKMKVKYLCRKLV